MTSRSPPRAQPRAALALLLAAGVGLPAGLLSGCAADACGPAALCTWAGTGVAGFDGDGKDRRASALYWPMDVSFGPEGTPYLLDWNNHRVRRVDAQGRLQTVLGTETIGDGPDDRSDLSPAGAPGTQVNLNHPTDLVFLPGGEALLAAWHNHKLRRWNPADGTVRVACGAGPGFAGDGGPAHAALLDQPKSLVVTPEGHVLVLDQRNQRVRRIDAHTGLITTVVGTGEKGFGGDGGPPRLARLAFPDGGNPQPGGALALDAQGRLYVADTENHRIRVVDLAADTIHTLAGTGEPGFSGDGGPAAEARLNQPRDLALGPDGRLYVADTENHAVRRIDLATGTVETVVGTGAPGRAPEGAAPRQAALARPFGIAFGPDGDLFVADTFNHRILRVPAEALE